MRVLNKTKYVLGLLYLILFLTNSNFLKAQKEIVPTMKISNGAVNETPVKIETFNVDIKVVGQIAITTLDITYRNNNNRILEGDFNFPLGEGQTVSRFALDINGKLREGVVVDKAVGRKTFEAIVRRGVDPGLLEKTEGNNFRARIYPIPAMGTRRVVIAFEQELTDKGAFDLFLLPLKITEIVKKFTLHAEVIKNKVSLNQETNQLTNLTFTKWNDSYIANLDLNDYTPDKQIALSFPHVTDSVKVYTTSINNNVDSSYFYINLRPTSKVKEKVLPSQIVILWDNSNSAQSRDIEKELSVLESYIQKIGNVTVQLVPFNITTEKADTVNVFNGNCEQLKQAIKNIEYDGGTSFGSIDISKLKADEILLFSDGISNFGETTPKFSNIPINVISSSQIANHSFLTYIAQRMGGVYLNLNKLTTIEASKILTTSSFQFISAVVENGAVSNIYPSIPCQIGNSFSLAGIMKGREATITLNFGFGTTVVYSKKATVLLEKSSELDFLGRIWAEKKIAELSINEETNKAEINKMGKEFGIVTPNTSLIVLETLADYLQYEIVPPVEMQNEYFAQLNTKESEAKTKVQNHINFVVDLSTEQSKWWNTKYPILLNETPKKSKQTGSRLYRKNTRNRLTQTEITQDAEVSEDLVIRTEDNLNSTIEVQSDTVVLLKNKEVVNQVKSDFQLNAWDPQTPYLKVLEYALKGQEYQTYLKLKKEYGSTPSFYIDASDYFLKLNNKVLAKKILSNLAEIEIESPQLLRVLGEKLKSLSCTNDAVIVYERVLKLKEEEPQSYRDLGLAYEANGNHQKAISTLYEVVKKEWDGRFRGIELIVMNEINNIIAQNPTLNYSFIDKRLVKKEPVDIRVEITWDTDNCDIDLWVTDPSGEKCFYSNKLTKLGGKISNDFTGGYGPEEFMLKKAITGQYQVQANYYGTRSQTILAPVSIHVAFILNFGKPNQKKQEITIRLENKKDVIDIGKFSFETEVQPKSH